MERPGNSSLIPLDIQAGMVSDVTNYAAAGTWWTGDAVRFQDGLVEKIGGWNRRVPGTWTGTPCALHFWLDLNQQPRWFVGTTTGTWLVDASGVVTQVTHSPTPPSPQAWSFDNWGEDIIMVSRGGAIQYYDTSAGTRTPLSSTAGAADVPAAATEILVDPELRYALVFGAAPLGSSAQDKMFIRWPNRGTTNNFTPGPNTTAGGVRLPYGSEIITAARMRREVVVFTDEILYSGTAGGSAVWNFTPFGPVSLIGPRAKAVCSDGVLRWMGTNGFYSYDGRVNIVDCTVEDRIYDDLNRLVASQRVCAVDNSLFNEIWWSYPSAGSSINDRYVIYNYRDGTWATGSAVKRDAWYSTPSRDTPFGVSVKGLFDHEVGTDDTDDGSAVPIYSWARSTPLEVPPGDTIMSISQLIPDTTFRQTSSFFEPTLNFRVAGANYPGSSYSADQTRPVEDLGPGVDVRAFTDKLDLRVRGRKMTLQVANDQIGVFWRLGRNRIRVKLDGSR